MILSIVTHFFPDANSFFKIPKNFFTGSRASAPHCPTIFQNRREMGVSSRPADFSHRKKPGIIPARIHSRRSPWQMGKNRYTQATNSPADSRVSSSHRGRTGFRKS